MWQLGIQRSVEGIFYILDLPLLLLESILTDLASLRSEWKDYNFSKLHISSSEDRNHTYTYSARTPMEDVVFTTEE